MLGSLILNAAGTAGMMASQAGEGTAAGEKELSKSEGQKLWKSISDGPIGMMRLLRKMGSKAAGTAGLNLSLASVLRQSQIFTATVGAFFQLIGAFLDVTFAPFMPIIFWFFSWLAKNLPRYAQVIDDIVKWFSTVWNWIKENFAWKGYQEEKEKRKKMYARETWASPTGTWGKTENVKWDKLLQGGIMGQTVEEARERQLVEASLAALGSGYTGQNLYFGQGTTSYDQINERYSGSAQGMPWQLNQDAESRHDDQSMQYSIATTILENYSSDGSFDFGAKGF